MYLFVRCTLDTYFLNTVCTLFLLFFFKKKCKLFKKYISYYISPNPFLIYHIYLFIYINKHFFIWTQCFHFKNLMWFILCILINCLFNFNKIVNNNNFLLNKSRSSFS